MQMASVGPIRASPSIKAFAIAKVNAAKAFKIIDRQSRISTADSRGLKPAAIEGNIRFDNVQFAYPIKQDKTILLNFIDFFLSILQLDYGSSCMHYALYPQYVCIALS
jgi:ABC-type transport system involved in Fe-S cluster assembly fused permease/ATPase subunit